MASTTVSTKVWHRCGGAGHHAHNALRLHARGAQFRLRCRSAGMHWIAVLERPGQASPTPIEIRTGILQSRTFAPDCTPGDWNSWEYAVGRAMPSAPTVVGTPARMRGDVALSSVVFGAFVSDAYLVEGMPAARWRVA